MSLFCARLPGSPFSMSPFSLFCICPQLYALTYFCFVCLSISVFLRIGVLHLILFDGFLVFLFIRLSVFAFRCFHLSLRYIFCAVIDVFFVCFSFPCFIFSRFLFNCRSVCFFALPVLLFCHAIFVVPRSVF